MTFRALLFSGLILLTAPDLRAQGDGCVLLKPADVSALLGGTAVASPTGGAGTAQDLAAFLPVARKAAAAF